MQTMQAFFVSLVALIVFASRSSALRQSASFGRRVAPITPRMPSPLLAACRPCVCTSLSVINKLGQPEGPNTNTIRWENVATFATLFATLVTAGVLVSLSQIQGQTLATQGQMLATLSSKFDQVVFFVAGIIALAAFGGSVVTILKYRDDVDERKKKEDAKKGKHGPD